MRKKCMIGTGAMCDPYLHAEKDLGLTRKCLEIINRYEYGVTVLTKPDSGTICLYNEETNRSAGRVSQA